MTDTAQDKRHLVPLPDWMLRLGSDGSLLAKEYLDIIQQAIDDHPRSQQVEIGPSEIGDPCGRRIAYKLLALEEKQRDGWLATVGTAVHSWLETAFDKDNLRSAPRMDGYERWYIEETVTVGEVGGVEVKGHCDVYDRLTATVIDHKIVGPTQLAKYKRHGPGEQYRIQAHLYGRGWHRRGLPVDRVAIMFLPRNAPLHDAYQWSEPWDEQVALDALRRLEGITLAVRILGDAAPAAIDTAPAYCMHCPFYRAKSQNLATGCPGHPESTPEPVDQLAGLINQ